MRTGWLTAAVCGGLMVAGVWTGSWGRTGSLAQEPTAEAENAAVAGTPTLALEESVAPATTSRQTSAGENPLAVLVEGEVESANGAITQFRFLNAAREAFEKLDADGSGQLEGEELLALREALGMRDRKRKRSSNNWTPTKTVGCCVTNTRGKTRSSIGSTPTATGS
jgi:hypothetical protein